jgi:outer membrane autotransporter protein
LIGGDALITETWRAGLFAGYSRSFFDTSDSEGDSTNYHLGAYAGTSWEALSFRTGVNYTWHDVSTTRAVDVLGETLSGSYDAGSLNVFGEFSYRIDMAPAAFEPFVSLAHTRMKTDGFTETGGVSALSIDGDVTNTTYTTLGLRASSDVEIGSVATNLHGSLGWLYAFGDVDSTSTARFSTGDSFAVSGTPLDRNTALIEAGMDFTLSPVSTFSVTYTGQFGADAREHGASARLRVQF